MNKADVSPTYANRRICISFGYRPGSEMAKSDCGFIFDAFVEHPLCSCGCVCYCSPHQHVGFPFSTSSTGHVSFYPMGATLSKGRVVPL